LHNANDHQPTEPATAAGGLYRQGATGSGEGHNHGATSMTSDDHHSRNYNFNF
jgi:hypothetical protein